MVWNEPILFPHDPLLNPDLFSFLSSGTSHPLLEPALDTYLVSGVRATHLALLSRR